MHRCCHLEFTEIANNAKKIFCAEILDLSCWIYFISYACEMNFVLYICIARRPLSKIAIVVHGYWLLLACNNMMLMWKFTLKWNSLVFPKIWRLNQYFCKWSTLSQKENPDNQNRYTYVIRRHLLELLQWTFLRGQSLWAHSVCFSFYTYGKANELGTVLNQKMHPSLWVAVHRRPRINSQWIRSKQFI